MKNVLTLFLLFLSSYLSAQKHDNTWISGYEGKIGGNPCFGQTHIVFDQAPFPKIFVSKIESVNLEFLVAAISDKMGKLVIYTDGIRLLNYNHDTLVQVASKDSDNFKINIQGALMLPYPEKDSLYLLLYEENKFINDPVLAAIIAKLRHATIDMSKNNGKGKVISQGNSLADNYVPFYGKLTACKHANGKDWWILVMERLTNKFHRYLFTKDGISLDGTQEIGEIDIDGFGSSCFSTDGTKYAIYNNYNSTIGQFLDVYDFDRCKGLLSKPNRIFLGIPSTSGGGGIAFSPSSRFLYVGNGSELLQFDVEAKDIKQSKKIVAKRDSFLVCNKLYQMSFFQAQLAPNGKIYLSDVCAKELHVIEQPDLPDTLCQVKLHSVQLPTFYYGTLCNFPNFRLGKKECTVDTKDLLDTNIKIYPNPATDYIYLDYDKEKFQHSQLIISDIQGKTMLQKTLDDEDIDIHHFPQGIYFLQISKENKVIFREKVVILER